MASQTYYENGPLAKRPRHENGYSQNPNPMPSYTLHQQQLQQQSMMAQQHYNMPQVPYDLNQPTMSYSNQEFDFSDVNLNYMPQQNGYCPTFDMPTMSTPMPMQSGQNVPSCHQMQPMTSTQASHHQHQGYQQYSDHNLPSTSEQMPQQNMQQVMMSQSGYSMPTQMPVAHVSPVQQYSNDNYQVNDYYPREVTADLMREFLTNKKKYICEMTIHVPMAAQKSYKSEKRFVVPPPTVMLQGNGWANSRILPGGPGAEKTALTASMQVSGVDGTKKDLEKTPLEGNKLLLTAKSMFISTDEKKKMITLTTEIKPANFTLGPVISDRMKVMSKPSKKKQTAIGPDAKWISIQSHSRIALYNRLRSQNISTRFFYVNQKGIVEASSNQWSVLEIVLIRSFNDNPTLDVPKFEEDAYGVGIKSKSGNIQYGDIVALIDVATGIALPPMRIRKTVKTGNAYHTTEDTSGEPVSQLHMIVFENLDRNGPPTFLHANPENLKFCSGAVTQEGAVSVNDGCRWTIISAEATTHQFAPILHIPSKPVAPMPVLSEAEDKAVLLDGEYAIEFGGSFLQPGISVWFGCIKSPKTDVRSSEELLAIIPPLEQYFAAYPPEQMRRGAGIEERALPINLVRDDGVVYGTDFLYEYNMKQTGDLGRILSIIDLPHDKR